MIPTCTLTWRTSATTLALLFLIALPLQSFGVFGLTANTDYYTVDTGAGLVFRVRRTDNGESTQSAGDLMSLVYNGLEYQDQSKGSHINSGFDFLYTGVSAVTVSATVVNANYIRVTVQAGNLTHYYMARNGYPHIYMATSFSAEPDAAGGLCRYIVRIPSSLLPNGPTPSDIRDNTGAIEASDIFGMADGTTRSKHYSNMRLLDWSHIGATGNNVGLFMLRSNHEGDSGGPFYRSLINQCGDEQEIYEIINYGEAQTEPFRVNILNGPYTLVFTGGGQPGTNLDYSWIETNGLNLINWVSKTNRGAVTGTASGVPAGFQTVVGFANAQAQYWTVATNGSYTTPLMIPGNYTATLYKKELAVASSPVTVNAGVTNTLNLASTETTPSYIWKLGEWDGTPSGLLNADKMTTMHPSDVRMSNWAPGDFIVESNNASQFPCVHFRGANNPRVIKFNLAAAQITDLTLRIGATCSYNGGRPQVVVNTWGSAIPPPPPESGTRNITVGTYREFNQLYTYTIPANELVVGQNTLQIYSVSGSGDLGTWLSAGWAYDCIELDGPILQAPAAPTGLAPMAGNARVVLNWNGSPGATSYRVKRATVNGGPFITIASGVIAPTYTDAGLVNDIPYYYVVSAFNSMGESADSTSASATPFDLHAYWKFDESSGLVAADSAGDNDGTLASASATWVAGKTNNAVKLNGTTNSYVSLPAGLVSTLNDFSIATWVKVDTNATWARVFDFGTGTGNYMYLAPAAGGNVVRYAITTSSAGGEQPITRAGALSTGVWHHVAVTLSGTVGVLYVDGVAVGTNSSITLRPSTLGATTQNYFGKSQWNDPNLNGSIDDFRIYNRALSVSEISALFNPPAVPAAPTGLVATAGGALVNLSWAASAGASSYRVKRSATNGGPYTLVAAGVTTTNFSDTGVVGETEYFYVVSPVNVSGEGANSIQAGATPFDFHAFWKFDETNGTSAADLGGAYNGTLAAGASWTTGKISNAVSLNGTSTGYVSMPAGMVAALNDFSIATWVYVNTNRTWARLFDFGTGATNYMFLSPASGGNTIRYAITSSGPGGEQQINGPSILSTGVWHHVAVTLTGTIGRLYVDGVAVGTNASMALKPSSLGSTILNHIGKSQFPDPYINGRVDEFRIYRRALSAAEISFLFNPDGAPAIPTGLVAIPGDGQVGLFWNASLNAVSYNVKRASAGGGPYITITNVTTTSYTDLGRVNGMPYYYVVSALNAFGESSNSTVVGVVASDLVARWKFDEASGTNATDSAGSNHGTLAAGASWTTGKINNAVSLNGASNSYVSLPAGVVATLNDFSISTWVYVNTNGAWARLFDFGTGATNYMFLSPASGGNTIRYAITTNGAGASEQRINGPAVLSTGVWHHVAVTLSSTTGTLYVDGVGVGTNTSMTLKPSNLGNSTQNYIGKSQYAADPYLNGRVDDFRIYRRALSPAEVSTLFSSGGALPAAPAGLAATPDDGLVALIWNVSTNAASYNVKKTTISGGPYTKITNVLTVASADTNVVNSTRYYYAVSAVNIVGEGLNSTEAGATPSSTATVDVAMSLSDGAFNFSWPADHIGWRLQIQTNGLSPTNWFPVDGSFLTNLVVWPVDATGDSVFYRLIFP